MMEERFLNVLGDQEVLFDAYAASSAYVLHKAFEGIEQLQAFRGRKELAPLLVEHIDAMADEPADPIVFGAHLYALSLTGAEEPIGRGIRRVLGLESLRRDPLVGPLAAYEGAKLLRLEGPELRELNFRPQQMEAILHRLESKEVH